MSFYFYRQHDAMQCRIACMAMVFKYYGRMYSCEKLSHICAMTNEGVSMQALKQLAESLGFNVLCGKASLYQIKDINSPIILHWNQNHFVVLYKVKRGKIFYIADPAKGLVKYSLEEFKKHWVSTQSGGEEKGIAMFLEPTPAFYEKKMDEEPKEERSFKFLFGYIKQYRKYFGQIVLGYSWEVFCNSFFEVGRPTERWT